MKTVTCPKCLGTKEILIDTEHAKSCDLCDDEGRVTRLQADKFLLDLANDVNEQLYGEEDCY